MAALSLTSCSLFTAIECCWWLMFVVVAVAVAVAFVHSIVFAFDDDCCKSLLVAFVAADDGEDALSSEGK